MSTANASQKVELRDARLSDATHIATLADELGYPSTEPQMHKRLQTLLPDHRNRVIVAAASEAEVVGWLHIFRQESLESDPFAEIGGLIVAASHRGHGIGARLIEAARQWALDQGLTELRVRSRVERERAHRFYQRLGFKPRKTQRVLVCEL